MRSARLSLVIINVFQMTGLLRRTYYLNEQETKYFSIYLNNDDLKPHLTIGSSSGHAVLNETQWFILVTFKSDIPKNKVHKLGDSQHPVSLLWTIYTHYECEHSSVSK
jgi:hypothetical protein